MTERSSEPVHEIRLGGVRAAIWKTESGGSVRHNVTFERSYRVDDEWRKSHAFGRDDLLRMMKCADLACEWILANAEKPAVADSGE